MLEFETMIMSLSNIFQSESEKTLRLGWQHYTGQGGVPDFHKAAECFQQAASKGHAIAACNLGFMYYDGKPDGENFGEAIRYFTQAAEAGNRTASSMLGFMYYEGEGVERDILKAAKCFGFPEEYKDAAAMYMNTANLLNLRYMKEAPEKAHKYLIKMMNGDRIKEVFMNTIGSVKLQTVYSYRTFGFTHPQAGCLM